jgi:hypothetical protein
MSGADNDVRERYKCFDGIVTFLYVGTNVPRGPKSGPLLIAWARHCGDLYGVMPAGGPTDGLAYHIAKDRHRMRSGPRPQTRECRITANHCRHLHIRGYGVEGFMGRREGSSVRGERKSVS